MDGGAPGLETPVDPTGVLLVVAVLAAGTAFGLYRRRTDGRVVGSPSGPRLTAADLGADLGPRATLVQFSSAFCQPCRATRQVLDDVAGQVEGVSHVEIDAEARLELVRRLDILRTPTVLVLDQEGCVVRRASGQPRKADVIAALGHAVS